MWTHHCGFKIFDFGSLKMGARQVALPAQEEGYVEE